MITSFKSKAGHFCTYPGERNSSFSANCNALQALLSVSDIRSYREHIESTSTFLCRRWCEGEVVDKWVRFSCLSAQFPEILTAQNTSFLYSAMLLSIALTDLLAKWEVGPLDLLADQFLKDRVPLVLTQIVSRIVCSQQRDGSWGSRSSTEETAYAVMALKDSRTLPWFSLVREDIDIAIRTGQEYLAEHKAYWTMPQYLWIEKVTYGNPVLSEAYCLAAMKPPLSKVAWGERVTTLVNTPEKSLAKSIGLIRKTANLQKVGLGIIKLSAIEGALFMPRLKSAHEGILPGQKDAKNKYLGLVPLSWIIINNSENLFLPANLLWEMMVITVWNFRVDEYMETSVAATEIDGLEKLKTIIRDLCNGKTLDPTVAKSRKRRYEEFVTSVNDTNHDSDSPEVTTNAVHVAIGKYINAMLNSPSIQHASADDKTSHRAKLADFLTSHIDQIVDNKRFVQQSSWSPSRPNVFETPRSAFAQWLPDTGANSV